MRLKNRQHLEEEVLYESYHPVKLPSDFDKKTAILQMHRGAVILFEDRKQSGFYHKGVLKGVEGDYYYVEFVDTRVERNKEKTLNKYLIQDLMTFITRVF
jgi:hypothetical protein